jgi:hypothetical protein
MGWGKERGWEGGGRREEGVSARWWEVEGKAVGGRRGVGRRSWVDTKEMPTW